MPMVLWTCLFMEAQGYEVKDNILYQDKKSAILMSNNTKSSSGKRTKQINVRYFFVTDRLARKEISMEYCPTADTYGGFLYQSHTRRTIQDSMAGNHESSI